MPFPAFHDTCAPYGATLTDTLLRIAEQDAFRPTWSPDVLEELRRNLNEIPGLAEGAADRRIRAMTDAFPEALIEGYEPLIAGMTCDPKDRHVLAAELLGILTRAGVPKFVSEVRRHEFTRPLDCLPTAGHRNHDAPRAL